jgi:YD repeat-containing protein
MRTSLLAAVMLLAVAAPAPLAAQYRAYTLDGIIFGRQSSMNSTGWVAVYQAGVGPLAINPITGQSVSLGTLAGSSYAQPTGINDAGQVVGYSDAPGVSNTAVRWDAAGALTNIGAQAGWTESRAYGINNSGQVVGSSGSVGGYTAVRWDAAGNATSLGTLAGVASSEAFFINDAGQAVGYVNAGAGDRAVRWDAAGAPTYLGAVSGGQGLRAYGMNNAGQAVGEGYGPVLRSFAMFWDEAGTATRLPSLPTAAGAFAFGINNLGQAVGQSLGGLPGTSAVIWDPVSGIQTVADYTGLSATWRFFQAASINDRGDILALGQRTDANSFGWVVLHDPSRVTVPEPSTFVLLGVGFGALLLARRRRAS